MAKLNREIDWESVAKAEDDQPTCTVSYEEAKGETPKALLVVIDGEDCFIPKKQIMEVNQEDCTVEVAEWLCEKNGWI